MSTDLLPVFVSGVVLGSIYALMSMGLTVVWGGLRVLNLTQGALFMLGAYTAVVIGNLGLPPILGLTGAFLLIGLLGIAFYWGPLRLLDQRPDRENATLLATIGLATILENVALIAFGPRNRLVPVLVSGQFMVAGVVITWNAIMMTVMALVLLTLLGAAFKWTRLGLAIRALAQNRDGAQLAGVGQEENYSLALFISSGLAGVGGMLLGSYYFVSPYVGGNYLLIALIVTILGGLGSIWGTLAAAYIVGMIQSAVSFYVAVRWSLPVLFALIIVMLILRPGGIAGRMSQERL